MGRKQFHGFIYENINENECYIVDYKSQKEVFELFIPDEINGKKVTKMCLSVFVDTGNYVEPTELAKVKWKIKKVHLPETISGIIPPPHVTIISVTWSPNNITVKATHPEWLLSCFLQVSILFCDRAF